MTYFGVEGYRPRVTLMPIPQSDAQQYGEPDAQTTVAEFNDTTAIPPELLALLPLFPRGGERRVRLLWLRFYCGQTLKAISKDIGVSPERARQLLVNAAWRLRQARRRPEQTQLLSMLPENLLEAVYGRRFRHEEA